MRISYRGLIVACASLLFPFAGSGDDSAKLPGVNELPIVQELPNPFVMKDGSPVKTKDDWAKRREELKKLILGYEYGHVPPAGEVQASEENSSEDAQVHATVKEITLHMGPDGKLPVHLVLTIPAGEGPFPVIVVGDLCWGRVKPAIVSDVIGHKWYSP